MQIPGPTAAGNLAWGPQGLCDRWMDGVTAELPSQPRGCLALLHTCCTSAGHCGPSLHHIGPSLAPHTLSTPSVPPELLASSHLLTFLLQPQAHPHRHPRLGQTAGGAGRGGSRPWANTPSFDSSCLLSPPPGHHSLQLFLGLLFTKRKTTHFP